MVEVNHEFKKGTVKALSIKGIGSSPWRCAKKAPKWCFFVHACLRGSSRAGGDEAEGDQAVIKTRHAGCLPNCGEKV
ncbi:hypothetical protein XI25_04330 [Paenibacillus sp. DMB20]|nr:hypothetical protein XI25_04330 [Paenibacillus sp. DMB20]